MSEENDKDLERTQELYDFLRGNVPEGYLVDPSHQPKLTDDQAWTVIWYLGNQYWQVTDRVEKCDVCGDLYHSWQEGHCLDFGSAPYHFCESCMSTEEFRQKQRIETRLERSKLRQRAAGGAEQAGDGNATTRSRAGSVSSKLSHAGTDV